MRSLVARGSLPSRSSWRMRVNARSAAGDPARTPMNLDTAPPADWTPRRILTLPSGAVSSSWMSKRLMSVLMVISCSLRSTDPARDTSRIGFWLTLLWRLYFTFSHLLTSGKELYRAAGELARIGNRRAERAPGRFRAHDRRNDRLRAHGLRRGGDAVRVGA